MVPTVYLSICLQLIQILCKLLMAHFDLHLLSLITILPQFIEFFASKHHIIPPFIQIQVHIDFLFSYFLFEIFLYFEPVMLVFVAILSESTY